MSICSHLLLLLNELIPATNYFNSLMGPHEHKFVEHLLESKAVLTALGEAEMQEPVSPEDDRNARRGGRFGASFAIRTWYGRAVRRNCGRAQG